jgi:flagellar protein FliS
MDAATAYQRRALESASPIGLIVLLYQAAGQQLRRALAAMDCGDIEARTSALNRVLAIVGELRAVLDYERGGEVARQFARFYYSSERALMDAACRQDPAPLRDLLNSFQQVQEAWRRADALPPGAHSVSGEATMPAAPREHLPWQA